MTDGVNIEYAIEGILFAAGEPVKASKLAAVLEVSIDEISEAAEKLKNEYDTKMRGLKLMGIDEG